MTVRIKHPTSVNIKFKLARLTSTRNCTSNLSYKPKITRIFRQGGSLHPSCGGGAGSTAIFKISQKLLRNDNLQTKIIRR